MHCPNCGQQQISNEIKFCSRCGMPLGLVSQLLAHGGFLPELTELSKGKLSWLTRKNGVVFSIIWLIFWVMMLPAFIGLAGGEEAAGVPAIFGLFTTMIFLIISFAYLKKTPKAQPGLPGGQPNAVPAEMYPPANRSALPPQQSGPANAYVSPAGSWRDTNDLEPISVTEGTTRLLEKDEI